jgi:hypothetical protein
MLQGIQQMTLNRLRQNVANVASKGCLAPNHRSRTVPQARKAGSIIVCQYTDTNSCNGLTVKHKNTNTN